MEQQLLADPDTAALLSIDFSVLNPVLVAQEVRNRAASEPLPARSLEEGPDDSWVVSKKYSNSNRTHEVLRERVRAERLGQLALDKTVTVEDLSLDLKALLVTMHTRVMTSLREMIQSKEALRKHINLDYKEKHLVREGHIMDTDGVTRLVRIYERGHMSAQEAAKTNPLMATVATRTAIDVLYGQEGENTPIGSTLFALSAHEVDADDPFKRAIGWHEGLIFGQATSRISEDTVEIRSYSVDPVHLEIARRAWEKVMGITIPVGTPSESWQAYMSTSPVTAEQGELLLITFREECYAQMDDKTERYTLEDIFEMNKQASDEIFFQMYLRGALITPGEAKDGMLNTFVEGLLGDPDALREDVYWSLLDMYNRNYFIAEDAVLLEHLVRYAAAKHYCDAFEEFLLNGEHKVDLKREVVVPRFVPVDLESLVAMAHNLAGAALRAARSNDVFGGCTDPFGPGKDPKKNGPGKDSKDGEKGSEDDSEESNSNNKKNWVITLKVCKTENCPSRGASPKKAKRDWCGPCNVCMAKCQPIYDVGKEPKWKKREVALAA